MGAESVILVGSGTRAIMMLAHGEPGLRIGAYVAPLILWLILAVYAIGLGLYGILKPSLRSRDSVVIGGVAVIFALASLALFHLLDIWIPLLTWLAASSGALGLLTVVKRLTVNTSTAEPATAPNGEKPREQA